MFLLTNSCLALPSTPSSAAMHANSSEVGTDFSRKLYEQIRFDDVWNKKRLVWYVKASQMLVNRALIEKFWLLLHATQIFGIFWINMLAPSASTLSPFALRAFFAESPFRRRCQGQLRWPSDFCIQGPRRKTSCFLRLLVSLLRSVVP